MARSGTVPDWKALAAGLDGVVLRPGDDAYDETHRLVDPAYDRIRPAAVVVCCTASDVAEALRFAGRYDLGVTVRSGGHSSVGAGTLWGGLVLDVRPLNEVHVDGDVVVVGGGATHERLYTELAAHGRVLPAGQCGTVGVAALALGGGIGKLTRTYGLTCDRLEAVQLITADGVVREVDAERHPDLFWACRGGGGGTVGVAVRLVLRTSTAPRLGWFAALWDRRHTRQVVRGWQRLMREAGDEVTASLELRCHDGRISAAIAGIDCGDDPERHVALAEAAVGTAPVSATILRDRPLGPLHRAGRLPGHLVSVHGSDVLANGLPDTAIDRLVEALEDAGRRGISVNVGIDPLTGAASRPVGASAWPWRGAFASVFWQADVARPLRSRARSWLLEAHRRLGPWSLGGYVNLVDEVRDPSRAGAASTYLGRSRVRLRAVRARYDPEGRLRLPYLL